MMRKTMSVVAGRAAITAVSAAVLIFPCSSKATAGNAGSLQPPERSEPAKTASQTDSPFISISASEQGTKTAVTVTNDTTSRETRTTIRVGGTDLGVEPVGRPFRKCPRDLKYRVEERTDKSAGRVLRVTTLVCDSARFVFRLEPKTMSIDVGITFPKGRDRDPEAPDAGIGKFPPGVFTEFPEIVRSLPHGDRWAGLKLFAEQNPTWNYATRVYAVPVDSKGRAVTALGNGQYVVLKCMYAAGHDVYVFPIVVTEPDGKYSLPVAGGKR